MSFRHVPVRYESDWWTRSHFPPPMSLMPSYNYSEPFPMENRWYHHDAPDRYANNDMRRMTEEMNKMMTTMQKSGPQAAPSVEDWRLTENFRLDNPVLQDRDGARKFHLQFDVRQFKPEEITVKTSGNQLSVHAKHDDKESGRSTFREYSRQYMLPKEVNPELLISKLSSDGMLSIEAPLPALAGPRDKLIPIEHRVDHKIIPAATADDDISDNCRLWIGNLDSRLTEYALLRILQKFGHLQKFDFLIHKSGPDKGKPRGYCFVTYETKKEAEMAMFKMNGKMALSRRMIVKWAHEETEEKEDNKSTKAIVVDSGPIISADSKIREIEAKLKSMEEARGQLRMQTMPVAPPGSSKLCAANIEARKKLENTKPYVKRPQKR